MKAFDVFPPEGEMDEFTYRLLRSWHFTLRKYEKKWREIWEAQTGWDLPYVYNETAQAGLLAVAAWRIGCLPFLEFDREKRETDRGRQDLELVSSDGEVWNIECKYLCPDWNDRPESIKATICSGINSAVGNVKDLKYKGRRNMGIVFVRPYWKDSEIRFEDFSRSIVKVTKSLRRGFCGIHYCRGDIWKKSGHPDCPGIAIVGRRIY